MSEIIPMRTLSFPRLSNTVYPVLRFPDLANFRRQTDFNKSAFITWVSQQPFNVENEHVVVGILQQLSIDPSWDLQYVVEYAKFRAYSLCTLFKITSIHNVGQAILDGFYRENTREHWCLIDNNKVYVEENLDIEKLCPLIPLCSTVTKHGYRHNQTKKVDKKFNIGNLAIIGLDIVELAVGWWLYQRMGRERDTGPAAYAAQYPFLYAQLIHNQLSVINVLYDHVLNGVPLKDLIKTETVTFTTTDEQRLYTKLIEFLVSFYGNRRLQSFEHFLVAIPSIYTEHFFNYIRAGDNALFSQTMWIWEPAILKLYALYLTFCNNMDVKASDITTAIVRTHPQRIQNYARVPEAYFKGWFLELADKALELANLNIEGKK